MAIVDLTSLVLFDDVCIVAKKGDPEVDPRSFLLVLRPAVWAFLLGSLLLVWMTGMLISLISKRSRRQLHGIEIFSHQVRTLLNQGKYYLILYSLWYLVTYPLKHHLQKLVQCGLVWVAMSGKKPRSITCEVLGEMVSTASSSEK